MANEKPTKKVSKEKSKKETLKETIKDKTEKEEPELRSEEERQTAIERLKQIRENFAEANKKRQETIKGAESLIQTNLDKRRKMYETEHPTEISKSTSTTKPENKIIKSAVETRDNEVSDFISNLIADEKTRKEYIEENKYETKYKPISKIITTVSPKTPEQQINEERIQRYGQEKSISQTGEEIKEPVIVDREKRQPNKEYVWIPTKQGWAEYEPKKKIIVENALTQMPEIVTMEKLKYLYEPVATGFVKQRRNTIYQKDSVETIDVDGKLFIPPQTQITETAKIKVGGKIITVTGRSKVSGGNLSLDVARNQALGAVKRKAYILMDLIRQGVSIDKANEIANEKCAELYEVNAHSQLPQGMEFENDKENYDEREMQFITSRGAYGEEEVSVEKEIELEDKKKEIIEENELTPSNETV